MMEYEKRCVYGRDVKTMYDSIKMFTGITHEGPATCRMMINITMTKLLIHDDFGIDK